MYESQLEERDEELEATRRALTLAQQEADELSSELHLTRTELQNSTAMLASASSQAASQAALAELQEDLRLARLELQSRADRLAAAQSAAETVSTHDTHMLVPTRICAFKVWECTQSVAEADKAQLASLQQVRDAFCAPTL